MDLTISLKKLTSVIVNINDDLFKKYETGIRKHFTEYMQQNYASSIHGDQVDMSTLGIGLQALRDQYIRKSEQDYSAQDSAEFALSGHNLFTAEFMSSDPVSSFFEKYYNAPGSIEHVYVKRSTTTGRLVPCVNQRFVESVLAEKKIMKDVEDQLRETDLMLRDNGSDQFKANGYVPYQTINLIAEKTAEIILRQMNLSQAV